MTNSADEELVASKTEGFKVGEKKTIEEYAKLGRAFTCMIRVVFDINFKERFSSYMLYHSSRMILLHCV